MMSLIVYRLTLTVYRLTLTRQETDGSQVALYLLISSAKWLELI